MTLVTTNFLLSNIHTLWNIWCNPIR